MADSSGRKRLYFGLWPDAELRSRIAAAADVATAAADGRPVPARNYHVTLAFLGQVSAHSVQDLTDAAAAARFLPFDLPLDRFGLWPRSGVAWFAPSACPPALEALVDDLWRKLEGLGLQRENRPYRPHISLARKCSRGLEKSLAEPLVWTVRDFHLVESRPSAEGSDYTLLQQFSAGN